jgi:hypothetical protein
MITSVWIRTRPHEERAEKLYPLAGFSLLIRATKRACVDPSPSEDALNTHFYALIDPTPCRFTASASSASSAFSVYQQATGGRIAEAIADLLAVGRRFAGSMRLSPLAKTLPAIIWLETIGSLERQHPAWILRGKSADLIQLPKLVLSECEFDRREIVLELVDAFCANDD